MLDAPVEITEAARLRILDVVAAVDADMGEPGGFFKLFPRFEAAVAALPDLSPAAAVGQEPRFILLDSYEMSGFHVPDEVYRILRVERSRTTRAGASS